MTDRSDDVVVPSAADPAVPLSPRRLVSSPYVVPGPLASALGYAAACVVLATIATVAVGWGASRDFWGYVWTVIVAAFYAAGLGLFTLLPVALVLGWMLRRVPNQGIHVLAFFLVPLLLGWIIIGLTVHAVLVPLLMGTAIGVSMAAGRALIWGLIDS